MNEFEGRMINLIDFYKIDSVFENGMRHEKMIERTSNK